MQFEGPPPGAGLPVDPVLRTASIGTDADPVPERPDDDEAAVTRLGLDDLRLDTYAQILHDEPLQLVIAAMLRLDAVPAQYRLPALTRSVELLERTVDRQRHLVHAMGAPDADDSIAVVVGRDAAALLAGRQVRIAVTDRSGLRLSARLERAARDILFAALCEIRLRSTLTAVHLDLHADAGALVVTLEDDGDGSVPPGPRPAPPGLADLRVHAAAVGGTLDIGPGNTLTLTLPAAAPARPVDLAAPTS